MDYMLSPNKIISPFDLLALLDFFPEFRTMRLRDVAYFPDVFASLAKLYKNKSISYILERAPYLVDHIDESSLVAHGILELLINPGDNKGDNYRVVVEHDANGNLLPLKIIGIDNDDALQFSVKNVKKQEVHLMKVKSVVYCLLLRKQNICVPDRLFENIMQPNFLESIFTEVVLLKDRYANLLDPYKFHEDGYFSLLEERYNKLKDLLTKNRKSSWLVIFRTLDPLVSKFYEAKFTNTKDHSHIMASVYNKEDDFENLYCALAIDEVEHLKHILQEYDNTKYNKADMTKYLNYIRYYN